MESFRAVANGLKILRDRELMHIDETGVLDRERIWEAAALNPRELQGAVKSATRILERLAVKYQVDVPPFPVKFNGPRASQIARHLYKYAP